MSRFNITSMTMKIDHQIFRQLRNGNLYEWCRHGLRSWKILRIKKKHKSQVVINVCDPSTRPYLHWTWPRTVRGHRRGSSWPLRDWRLPRRVRLYVTWVWRRCDQRNRYGKYLQQANKIIKEIIPRRSELPTSSKQTVLRRTCSHWTSAVPIVLPKTCHALLSLLSHFV